MPDWQTYLSEGRRQLARVPTLGWVAAGVIGLSLGVALYLETGAPPYVALYEGLPPSDGGAVIAQLQKLGIPYELEAAGDVILVPQSQLASARLQLGAARVPGTTVTNGWDKVENAPMTASDLAQTTMADQALEASLAQSINSIVRGQRPRRSSLPCRRIRRSLPTSRSPQRPSSSPPMTWMR